MRQKGDDFGPASVIACHIHHHLGALIPTDAHHTGGASSSSPTPSARNARGGATAGAAAARDAHRATDAPHHAAAEAAAETAAEAAAAGGDVCDGGALDAERPQTAPVAGETATLT